MGQLGRKRRRGLVLVCGTVFACAILGAGPALAACGDGVLDVGERCDHGAANGGDGCCTTACTLVDADADGVCDALDPCTNVGSTTIESARVTLTNPVIPSADARFVVRGRIDVSDMPTIDPASRGFRLVMRHSFSGFAVDATVPGGVGWTTNADATEWVYGDPDAVAGVTAARIRRVASSPGALTVAIAGTYAVFPQLSQTVPMKLSVVIDSPTATTGQCAERRVRPAVCRLDRAGRKLRCGSLPHLFPCGGTRPDALMRCDVSRAVLAEEAYWDNNLAYYTGLCTGLPGFVASPGVLCTVAGGYRDFIVSTVEPGVDVGCVWNTCLRPGTRPGACLPLPFTQSCGG